MNTMPPTSVPQSAMDIATQMLETTRLAYHNRDFEAFLACFLLPNVVTTPQGTHVIATESDLRGTFDRMLSNFDALGVIDMHRNVTRAAFIEPDVIEAHFISRHVLEGPRFGADVQARGKMARVEGEWLIADHYYVTNSAPLTRALTPE